MHDLCVLRTQLLTLPGCAFLAIVHNYLLDCIEHASQMNNYKNDYTKYGRNNKVHLVSKGKE